MRVTTSSPSALTDHHENGSPGVVFERDVLDLGAVALDLRSGEHRLDVQEAGAVRRSVASPRRRRPPRTHGADRAGSPARSTSVSPHRGAVDLAARAERLDRRLPPLPAGERTAADQRRPARRTAPEAVNSSWMNSEKVRSESATTVAASASPSTTRTPPSDATHVNAVPSSERNASDGTPRRSATTRCP